MNKLILSVSLSLLFLFSFKPGDEAIAQQRNPVLEEVTGTWCQWCPCGHDIMAQIKANIPNAIMIGYHGPANGTDPFSFFPGNNIISQFGFSGYPTAVIGRTSGIVSRGAWSGMMNTRNSIPANVFIDVDRSFNPNTREFNTSIDFTALTNLNGQYMFNVILLESGMVWSQAGNSSCTGGSNYVHNHVVRDMMNGSLGEEVINGVWKKPIHPTSSEYIFTENNTPTEFNAVLYNNSITKSVNYTIPPPGGAGPDMVWDNCDVVVLVYESGSPLSSNAEIQQAVEMTLISSESNANTGFLDDTYYISCSLEGPAGWTGEFTTANGTFSFGQVDSIQIASGDSAEVSISINPNGIGGYGETTLEFSSASNPGLSSSTVFRTITTTGVDILAVDASEENYGAYIFSALENVYTGTYGIVTRSALHASGVDISNFQIVTWSCGDALPVFTQDEVDMLQNYLDGGGRLFINGQDLGADIFEATGQSQFADSFYNNYLHARYLSNIGNSFIINGYDGDPISEGLQFVLNGALYTRSPDRVSPFNSEASPIFKFLSGPQIAAIKAATTDYRVVYLGFGFEQIGDVVIRDTLMARAINWLKEGIVTTNISIQSPNGGEVWVVGETEDITWASVNVDDVMIELSIDNGATWSTIISSTPSNGTYSWTVASQDSSDECLIKITNVTNNSINDASDGTFTIDIVSSVENPGEITPTEFDLVQNHPNPFNPSTTITYSLANEEHVSLKVYDIMGREVAELVNEDQAAGTYSLHFDASSLASGMYFYEISAGNFVATKKMVLLK
jgi:hypothetical protein